MQMTQVYITDHSILTSMTIIGIDKAKNIIIRLFVLNECLSNRLLDKYMYLNQFIKKKSFLQVHVYVPLQASVCMIYRQL